MRGVLTIIGGMAILGLISCGGAPPPEVVETPESAPVVTPVEASGAETVRADMGVLGGTLTLANGARLHVPRGALREVMSVRFQVSNGGRAFADRETQRPLGPVFSIEPGMAAASGAFEISYPAVNLPNGFERADLAFAVEEVMQSGRVTENMGTQTRWQFFPVRVIDDRFVVRMNALAGARIQFGVSR